MLGLLPPRRTQFRVVLCFNIDDQGEKYTALREMLSALLGCPVNIHVSYRETMS